MNRTNQRENTAMIRERQNNGHVPTLCVSDSTRSEPRQFLHKKAARGRVNPPPASASKNAMHPDWVTDVAAIAGLSRSTIPQKLTVAPQPDAEEC